MFPNIEILRKVVHILFKSANWKKFDLFREKDYDISPGSLTDPKYPAQILIPKKITHKKLPRLNWILN